MKSVFITSILLIATLLQVSAADTPNTAALPVSEPQVVADSDSIMLIAEQVQVPLPVKKTEVSPWSYGMFAGLGGVFPTSTISNAFSGGCRFVFGLNGGWRRFRVQASVGYTSPTIRNRMLVTPEYEGQGLQANVKNANLLDVGFGVGFAVLDTPSFSIEAHVGGRWSGYSWTARAMEPNETGSFNTYGPQHRIKLDDFNFACGIDFEWHFLRNETTLLGDADGEYVSSLRLTPFAMRGCYTDAIQHYSGWQFGFSVCYSGLVRGLR